MMAAAPTIPPTPRSRGCFREGSRQAEAQAPEEPGPSLGGPREIPCEAAQGCPGEAPSKSPARTTLEGWMGSLRPHPDSDALPDEGIWVAHGDRTGGGVGDLPPSHQPAARDPSACEAGEDGTEGQVEILPGGFRGLPGPARQDRPLKRCRQHLLSQRLTWGDRGIPRPARCRGKTPPPPSGGGTSEGFP